MRDAEGVCKTTGADSDFQPATGKISTEKTQAFNFFMKNGPSFRNLIPAVIGIGNVVES